MVSREEQGQFVVSWSADPLAVADAEAKSSFYACNIESQVPSSQTVWYGQQKGGPYTQCLNGSPTFFTQGNSRGLQLIYRATLKVRTSTLHIKDSRDGQWPSSYMRVMRCFYLSLKDLEPGKQYFYIVASGRNVSKEYSFTTIQKEPSSVSSSHDAARKNIYLTKEDLSLQVKLLIFGDMGLDGGSPTIPRLIQEVYKYNLHFAHSSIFGQQFSDGNVSR